MPAPTTWITVGLALALALLGLQGFARLRSTTLAAPCLWVALSAGCLALGAVLETKLDGISLSAARFAVATTTLCPLMAVLGAKRPQDRGWQWVVLTLWIILVWPAAQAVVLPAGVKVDLFIAWKMFLWALIALGLLNYLPTCHWRAAILVALGQVLVLRDYLGLPEAKSIELNQLVATLSFFSAAALVAYRRQPASKALDPSLSSLDTRWLSFRNHYGAFWALRVLGRINQSAEQRHWPLQLTWPGFAPTETQPPPHQQSSTQKPSPQQASPQQLSEQQLTELDQAINSMLRRFVAVGEE